MRTNAKALLAAVSGLALTFFAVGAPADEVADFYAGKTVTIYIGAAGGSYGVWGQLASDHLGAFIPGKPAVIAQPMPGAGGAKAANYVFNAAPKDGTAIGLLLKYVALEQASGRPAVKYDVRKFNWLISTAPINSVVAIWHKAPATTLEGARRTELIMGSTGKSSETYITPMLMNAFMGTRFKVVTGYKGPPEIHLAMEQGELHGRAASFESIVANRPRWLETREAVMLAHSGLYRDPAFPGVPTLVELADNPEAKAIFEFVGAGSTVGRIFVAPPGVPQPRVAALRSAFEQMVKDPKFLADAKKRRADVAPRSAQEVEALMRKTIDAPQSIIDKTKEATR